MEERPEFQLPIGGQEFIDLIAKLPPDRMLRAEAARLLGQIWRPFLPVVQEHILSVETEWRMDVIRAWAQALALIPVAWRGIATQLITSTALPERVGKARALAGLAISMAPQYFSEAIASLDQVPTSEWLGRLDAYAQSHPKWLTPPTTVATFTSLPADTMSALRQWVPPPPAPQAACVVGAFDPAWGTPPDSYLGVPLRFDPTLGAYEFDEAYARAAGTDRTSPGVPLFGETELGWLRDGYASGQAVLQPIRRPGSSEWEFRWISRDRQGPCVAS